MAGDSKQTALSRGRLKKLIRKIRGSLKGGPSALDYLLKERRKDRDLMKIIGEGGRREGRRKRGQLAS